ncbi:MAG: cytochrome oxidase small assembly protein [Betaproteobacteria bacterium]|nr:cytochrome oxidase small assembly protein [Betaproteobacteria bacterium]
MDERAPAGKYKTALILALIAAAFFVSVIIRHWQ